MVDLIADPDVSVNETIPALQRNTLHSRKGRIGVLSHAARILLAFLIIIAFMLPFAMTVGFDEESSSSISSGLSIVLLIVFIVGLIYGMFISIVSTVKRLHDINFTGWFYLICVIPIVGALFYLFVSLKRGTDTENRFGMPSLTSQRETIFGYVGIAALFLITAGSIVSSIMGW